MDEMTPPRGYVLGKDQTIEDVLAIEAELLRSEGIDPMWPGFGDRPERESPKPAD
jgi:hypothetical protein